MNQSVSDPGTKLQRKIWKACDGLPYGPLPMRMTCPKCPSEFCHKHRAKCSYCQCELKTHPEHWLNNLPIPARIRRRVRALAINTRRDLAHSLQYFFSKRFPLWVRLAFMWLAFTILPISGGASTYYISTTGSDGAAGGAGTPWATFDHAATVMVGGDTLIAVNGTYDQQIGNFTGGGSGAPTIIQAQNRNLAILFPASAGGGVVNIVDPDHITFDGLVVDATNAGDEGGYYFQGSTTNMIVQNGTIRNSVANGILVNGSTQDTFNQYLNNDFIDNGAPSYGHGIYCPTSGNIIDGNRIRGGGYYGIQVYRGAGDANDNIVRNNVIGPGNLHGMIVGSGSGNLVYSNIIYGNTEDGMRVRYGAVDNGIYNNSIWGNGGTGLFLDGSASNTQVKNNIVFGNGAGIVDGGAGTIGLSPNVGNVTGNPNFTNPSGGDFTLQLGSAAIGVGANLSAIFTTDIIGVARTVPWDAGAYAYGPSGLPTVTTTTATNIVVPNADAGGNVTAGGTSPVTWRGVAWGTSPNPTIAGNFTSNGTGTGAFASVLTGLLPGTTYYYRAGGTNLSGTAYGANLSFATTPATGQGVTSRDLNGTSQQITMGDVIDITSAAMSIVAWIKPDTYGFGDLGRIVDKRGTAGGAGYVLGFDNFTIPGSMFFTSVDTSVNSAAGAVALGAWQQVAVTYDGTNVRFYVNGVIFGSPVPMTTVPTNSAVALILGGRDGDLIRLFDGMMSEVGIWSSVLTGAQIAALALCPDDTGLIATAQGYWHLGVASPETDASGNGRTGTLVGSPAAGTGPSFTCGVTGGIAPAVVTYSRQRRS